MLDALLTVDSNKSENREKQHKDANSAENAAEFAIVEEEVN